MPRGGQFRILGKQGCAGKCIGSAGAIVHSPGGQPGDPPALRHPRTRSVLHGLGQGIGAGVVVLDIEAPGHLRSPFSAGAGGKLAVDPVEQGLGPGRIVGLDLAVDPARNAARHGAIGVFARADALGKAGLGDHSLRLGQRGDGACPALLGEARNLFGLRQSHALGQPGVQRIQFDPGGTGCRIIFRPGHLVQRTSRALGEHGLNSGPVPPVDRGKQFAVEGAVFGAQQAGQFAAGGMLGKILHRCRIGPGRIRRCQGQTGKAKGGNQAVIQTWHAQSVPTRSRVPLAQPPCQSSRARHRAALPRGRAIRLSRPGAARAGICAPTW